MGLFRKLAIKGMPDIDWEMTPEYTFGTYESWGGKERVRSKKERVYYFFIDAWDDEPKLCLMERGIKHARVVAEITRRRRCSAMCQEQGKVALFERTHPINEELKQWLIANVMDTEMIPELFLWMLRPLNNVHRHRLAGAGCRTCGCSARISLPHEPEEMSEEDMVALVAR
jgi:hypothetical protein